MTEKSNVVSLKRPAPVVKSFALQMVEHEQEVARLKKAFEAAQARAADPNLTPEDRKIANAALLYAGDKYSAAKGARG